METLGISRSIAGIDDLFKQDRPSSENLLSRNENPIDKIKGK